MSEDRYGEILIELREIRANGVATNIQVTRLVERDAERDREVTDHEGRIRFLEKLQWGLPVTGITALGAMVLSAWKNG